MNYGREEALISCVTLRCNAAPPVPILLSWQAHTAPGIMAGPSAADICLSIDQTGLALDQTKQDSVHRFLQESKCQPMR